MDRNYYKPSGFGGFSFFPPVIKNLLIINVVVFLIQTLGGQVMVGNGMTFSDILTRYFALIPIGGIDVGPFTHWSFYPWQLITYQFMHGGLMHIFFNLFVLWMFGVEVEHILGSKKFLYFYLICGVAAGLSQLFITPLLGGSVGPTIGASGAIYGVMVAFALLFPNRLIFLYFLIPVKAKYLITGLVIFEYFYVGSASGNIAHLAHLGGAVAGFVYFLLDSSIDVDIKRVFRKRGSYYSSGNSSNNNPFQNVSNIFKKKEKNVEDAKFYEIKDDHPQSEQSDYSQAEIDEILDKISRSGYQNLTPREKKILFEASKKMK